MRHTFLLVLLCFHGLTPAVGHEPLLPQPAQIKYRGGRLPLRGLSIKVSKPGPEDQFAATELSSWLSRRAGTAIRVVAGNPTGRTISLVRTGSIDALPGPDDHAGSDSREAYEIRIDPRSEERRVRKEC